jgi:glycosyltransferase involved in cell wall biosynthesis
VCQRELLRAEILAKKLTVGIDIRDLRVAKTGTRTYLDEICKAFKKMDLPDVQFHFLDTDIPIYTGNNTLLKWIGHFRYQLWKQLILPFKAWQNKCDIIFCTDNCVPLIHLGYKTIPVLHDAFCFESPESYGKLWLWLYLKTAIPAAQNSAFVITPTAYAKKQISKYTKIPDNKLIVIYEGPKTFDLDPALNKSNKILQSLQLNAKKYILHVGSMYKRKNIFALVQAFGKVKELGYDDIKLVLAGPTLVNGIDSDHKIIVNAIESMKLKNDVVITGYLSDHDISQLYDSALMYVFPSLNEGFGIPVLEAFTYNLPLIVANNTCLPEVGGDAILAFDPYTTEDLLAKIKMVLDDERLREEMIAKGQERLKDFSWHKTAIQLISVFKNAVNN